MSSSRCYPSRKWKPIFEALQTAVKTSELDIDVITSGCLEVCKMGLVVFYSADRTWYTRVTSDVAGRIVNEHLLGGMKLSENFYPQTDC